MSDFAGLTRRAVSMAEHLGPPYSGPLKMLAGMEDETGPLDDASDLQLDVIALAMGLDPAGWRNVASSIPLTSAHADKIIDCLEESARLWSELSSLSQEEQLR